MKNDKRKVRRIEVEKVKDGKGGHLHKVTVYHHDRPAKEGKGMKNAMPSYEPPEETYHNSHGSAKKHIHKSMQRMTASPEEEPEGITSGVNAAGAAANDISEPTEDEE